jgi:group I intron endonuclease
MDIYTIYKATNNLDGKIYIGFDSNWPNRKTAHKRNSKKNLNSNTRFYNAIRKYGWENFSWDVLYQSRDGKHCLEIMEPYFISENNSMLLGYNMTPGGDGKRKGSVESIETRNRKSIAHTGKKLTSEHVENILKSRIGYKHSEEAKEKMSLARLGKDPWNKDKKGLQIPWSKGTPTRKICCVVCRAEIDYMNLSRWHKHII